MSEAPDYTKPVIGVREWVLNRGYLDGLCGMYIWPPNRGDPKAKCFANPHEAPVEDCACGWYAFYDLCGEKTFGDFSKYPYRVHIIEISDSNSVTQYQYGIKGIVSGWGKVILHDYGFRAEHMKIEALIRIAHDTEFPADDGNYQFRDVRFSMWRFAKRAAKIYNVPLIGEEDVGEFMDGLGGITPYPEYLQEVKK